MKEFEKEVLRRGFVLQEERERVSIDFCRMLLGKSWRESKAEANRFG